MPVIIGALREGAPNETRVSLVPEVVDKFAASGAHVCIERGAGIIDGIETRQLAPAMTRVNAILDDVKDVTTRVKDDTERVDRAIHTTIDRIDDTAGRVSGMIRGARAIVEAVLRAA